MKNSDYWKERFKQLETAQNQKGMDTYHEIEQQYRQAQREIEGKIGRWYQRFAANNEISMAEARKILSGSDLKEFKWDVQDYIKYGKENAIHQSWMKELENASVRFHISRLEALKLQTQQSLELMFGNQLDQIDSAMKRIYLDGYYHTAYELQNGFRIGWDIAGLDQVQIEKVIGKPWAVDGKNFSERIWNNKQKLISEVHTELTQNILLGADPQKAIDHIAKKMNTSKYNAGRLVMTEEAYFSSAAQKDCFDGLGVEEYEILATLDSHTSEICRCLDGQHFPMKNFEAGVTAPPFHVYCRSTTIPYFEENFGQVGERAARGVDGKTYYIPANMTYEEWKKEYVKSSKDIVENVSVSDIIVSPILNKDGVISKAKELSRELLSGKEVLNEKDNNPIFEYITRRLGYNKKPEIVDATTFEKLAKESPVGILYRGVNADAKESVEEYIKSFKLGKMFTGVKQAYGHGIYFSPEKEIASRYKKEGQYGAILQAILKKDAQVADYRTILKEYSLTGADIAKFKKERNPMHWEYLLNTVGEFAALAGFDAIAMNGFNGNNHVIVLNRGKVVIKE